LKAVALALLLPCVAAAAPRGAAKARPASARRPAPPPAKKLAPEENPKLGGAAKAFSKARVRFEAPAERFFMNVVLVRVLYAHALVLDGDLALGRLSFLARLIGHPRSRGPQALLSMKDVLPNRYPIFGLEVEELFNAENRLGRMMDYGVIGVRVDALYTTSARALGEPRLLELVVDGAPAYTWPADQRHVWKPQSQGRFTSLIEFLTRPSPADTRTVAFARV